MADPVTALAIGSMVATAAGGAVSAYGSAQGGAAQSAMYQYQAGVARTNAMLAQRDAAYATQAGEVSAQQAGFKAGQEIGQTRAAYGAGNVALATGTPERVLTAEQALAQQQQGIVRAGAAKQAYGFNVAAAQDVSQASAYDVSAGTAQTAGQLGAASTLLGTAGNVSSKWLGYSKQFPGLGGGGGGASASDYAMSTAPFGG